MNLKSRLLLLLLVFVPAIYYFQTTPLTLGLDLQGGTRLILEAQDKDDYVVDQSNDARYFVGWEKSWMD